MVTQLPPIEDVGKLPVGIWVEDTQTMYGLTGVEIRGVSTSGTLDIAGVVLRAE